MALGSEKVIDGYFLTFSWFQIVYAHITQVCSGKIRKKKSGGKKYVDKMKREHEFVDEIRAVYVKP